MDIKVLMVLLVAFIALSAASPINNENPEATAEVVKSELDNIGLEDFFFAYETSNGIAAEGKGHLNNAGSEDESLVIQGSFKYVGPDGVTYAVSYIADENGFKPTGDHLVSV